MTKTIETLSAEKRIELLRWMINIRQLDDIVGKIDQRWFAGLGEEAIVAGCFLALQPKDVSVPHYRGGLATSWMRGCAELPRLMAGALGKVTGPGKGISHAAVTGEVSQNHFVVFSGTLGPSIGFATGAGLAAKLDGKGQVVMLTFGDGASNQGLLHESMNLAAALRLPVVFVCQDNQIAITTRSDYSIPGDVLQRGSGYGMPAIGIDGNDAVAVFSEASAAAMRARNGLGPTFIHARTYRRSGHNYADSSAYRVKEEVEYWATRDPIAGLEKCLIADGEIGPTTVHEMEERAQNEIRAAIALVENDPLPGADVLVGDDAYAPSTQIPRSR